MRAIVQLLLVGMVLKTVFALASPLLIGAVALAMFVMASYEISSRQERRFAGAWGYGIGAGTTMLATLLVTAFALLGTLRPVPWYAPEVLIPLLGIILGNVMTAPGHRDAEQLLGCQTERVFLVHRRDVIEPVEVG